MKLLVYCLVLFFSTIHFSLMASPGPLVIDNSVKKGSVKYIKSAHSEVSHSLSIEEVRFRLLQATLTDKNGKWIMEEDGDGYFTVRRDRAGEVIYARIEYNDKYIQLKYVDRKSDYPCRKNVDGICYKNENNDFYSNFKRLRGIIIRTIKEGGS